jgi:hypothetical protein
MYRSHWHVLVATAPIAAFPLFLFTASLFARRRVVFTRRLTLIPQLACFIVIASGIALLKDVPNPISQLKRLATEDEDFLRRQAVYTLWVRRNAIDGEKVGISFPFGQLIARRADVVNVFPYPQAGSMLLKSQLRTAIDVLEVNKVTTLFGDYPPEFIPWMAMKGFREIERIGKFAVYQTPPKGLTVVPGVATLPPAKLPLRKKKKSSTAPR